MTESVTVLLDQNIPVTTKEWLASRRPLWKIHHALEVGLGGQSDEQIFQWAQKHNSVIITYDEDFADARMYALGSHHGIIRLRVWPTTTENTCSALERLLQGVPDEQWQKGLVIIDNQKIRIRIHDK